MGLCPFHNEKSPSFTVSPAKEIYKCFGCGKSGNTISFLMEHEKYSYAEALRWLAAKYNVEIEEKELSPELRQQQLIAEVVKPAEAEAERVRVLAMADAEKTRIQAEAAARGVTITILIDLIHVIEYLWKAGWAFHDPRDPAIEKWAAARALEVASDVRRLGVTLLLANSTWTHLDVAVAGRLAHVPSVLLLSTMMSSLSILRALASTVSITCAA